MANNSPEYRTIIQCTSDLLTAIKPNIDALSADLLEAELITQDNYESVTNMALDATNRATKLLSFLRNRVCLDTRNFHKFRHVLSKRLSDYREILSILQEKYRKLGK